MCVGFVEVLTRKRSAPTKARHSHLSPDFQVLTNVNNMVLKVMTLIIITHCIQNFIPIDLTIVKMLRAKEDVGEAMVFNPKEKP